MARSPYVVEFTAREKEVAALRRVVRSRLEGWGLRCLVDEAQLCVSELVANVIAHVGSGTPTTLSVLMNGAFLRIEVRDPDSRALPTLVAADVEAEGGRGMALVAAVSDRWGVSLLGDSKVTWCEIATRPTSPGERDVGPWVIRTEAMRGLYGIVGEEQVGRSVSPVSVLKGEEAAIHIITDLLHWLSAHGRDTDEVLDRAQVRFEAEAHPGSWC
ncbi:ATP-binding protein [Streptomyces sp. RM72]|uniref:ATP-binding protein n=1 Tax=Streptomyces sp. RM72 TaxID=1115510 RepID=UPI001B377A35|nr:ATP-binding protein [Streptomyces sp. RM72]MBQ0890521.1 ATP-binding protein [Streptomyces sp. RM72]